jgi:hypothetical protein
MLTRVSTSKLVDHEGYMSHVARMIHTHERVPYMPWMELESTYFKQFTSGLMTAEETSVRSVNPSPRAGKLIIASSMVTRFAECLLLDSNSLPVGDVVLSDLTAPWRTVARRLCQYYLRSLERKLRSTLSGQTSICTCFFDLVTDDGDLQLFNTFPDCDRCIGCTLVGSATERALTSLAYWLGSRRSRIGIILHHSQADNTPSASCGPFHMGG